MNFDQQQDKYKIPAEFYFQHSTGSSLSTKSRLHRPPSYFHTFGPEHSFVLINGQDQAVSIPLCPYMCLLQLGHISLAVSHLKTNVAATMTGPGWSLDQLGLAAGK